MAVIKNSIYKLENHVAFTILWGILGLVCASLTPCFIAKETKTMKEVGPLIFIVAFVAYTLGFLSREEPAMRVSIMKKENGWIGAALCNMLVTVLTAFVGIAHDLSTKGVYAQMMIAGAVFEFMELAKPVVDFGLLQYFLRLPFQTAVALAHKEKAGWAIAIPPTLMVCFCTVWQSLYLYTFDTMRSQPTAAPQPQPEMSPPAQLLPTTRTGRRAPRASDNREIRAFRF